MSDFVPRAVEECPGWVETDPHRFHRASEIDTLTTSGFTLRSLSEDADVLHHGGTPTDLLKAIAAAQRLEWKAKRLAELEVNPVAMCGHGYTGLCMACVVQQDLLRSRS